MSDLLAGNVILAAGLTVATQAIQIGAYSARYAGIVTGCVATAISLFSLLVTASRLAALFQVPALGSLADRTANAALDAHRKTVSPEALALFDHQMRIVVAANTVGVLLGALMLPLFLAMFVRGIGAFERLRSVPRALLRLLDWRVLRELVLATRVPSPSLLTRYPPRHLPAGLLIGNVIVTGIYAIGVVAATYASVLDPGDARTAVLLSGIINGIATIAFTLVVDPNSAYITDQAVKGERSVGEVKAMVIYLALTAVLGTLLSQLILYPSAVVIAFVAHLVNQLR